MQYQEVAPSPPLDSVVQCFWFLRGNLAGAPAQAIVPDGRMEIVLHLGEPFSEEDPAGCFRPQSQALIAGQLVAPIRVRPAGHSDVVGIRLRPEGARSIFGIPVHELAGAMTNLDLLTPGLAGALTGAVSGIHDPVARARSLGAVLVRKLTREPAGIIRHAVLALAAVRPPLISDLSRRLGMNKRTLERRVREETGLAPTTLRRVLRFRRAFRMLDREPSGEWSGIASRAGYFDQAHLIRDFRCFAGAPPSHFFREDPALSRALTSSEEPAA